MVPTIRATPEKSPTLLSRCVALPSSGAGVANTSPASPSDRSDSWPEPPFACTLPLRRPPAEQTRLRHRRTRVTLPLRRPPGEQTQLRRRRARVRLYTPIETPSWRTDTTTSSESQSYTSIETPSRRTDTTTSSEDQSSPVHSH